MVKRIRRPQSYRHLNVETLERRQLLAALTLATNADGMVADTNNDGKFDFFDSTGRTVTNRWFNATVGPVIQERDVFEFDLRGIAPGSTINAASFAFNVQSFTSSNGVLPRVILRAYPGDGAVTLGDATASAATIGTGTIRMLGGASVVVDRAIIEAYIGQRLTIRLENSEIMGQWASIATMESLSLDGRARLVLDVSDPASLAIHASPDAFWESAGVSASIGTVTRTGNLSQPMTITLSSSDSLSAKVPDTVTIPAGQASASFPIDAVDDFFADGDHVSMIAAAAVVSTSGPLTVDVSYGPGGLASTNPLMRTQFPRAAMAYLSDGKVLAASEAGTSSPSYVWQVTRLMADGTVDTTFGTNGVVTTSLINGNEYNPIPSKIVVQADGTFLVGGKFGGGSGRGILVRYSANGALDSTFGTSGIANLNAVHGSSTAGVTDIALRSDGRILLGFMESGTVTGVVAQLNPNGTFDSTFGVSGISRLHTSYATGFSSQEVEILEDGTFLVAGAFQRRAGVVHVQANGLGLVGTFGNNGIALADFNGSFIGLSEMQLDSRGRIVYAGSATAIISGVNQPADFAVARFLPGGTPDTSFAGNGATSIDIAINSNDQPTSMVIQSGDKITVGGVSIVSGVYDSALARLNEDGTLDTSFDLDGRYRKSLVDTYSPDLIVDLAQQPDGKLLALTGWAFDVRVARVITDRPPTFLSANQDVTILDDDPTAQSLELSTSEDKALNGSMVATDPNQDLQRYSVLSMPSSGSVTIDDPATGAFTYRPAPDFHGTDTFTFNAFDGTVTSNTATVTITVEPVNDIPVSESAWITTDEDIDVNGIVVATDVEGTPLTFSVVTASSNGTLIFDEKSGEFTYSPNENFNGSDAFTFKANDNDADSEVATVFITVDAVNDMPVVSSATFTLPEHSAMGEIVGTVVATDVDVEALSYSISSGNTNNAFAIEASSGEIRVANSSALDFVATPVFTLIVSATDTGGWAGQAEVTIHLTEVNPGVQIDINPSDPANTIDLAKDTWITVAILGSRFLDVTQLDVAALRFGASGTETSVERSGKGAKASIVFRLEDIDGDGDLDLLVRFETKKSGLAVGDTVAKLSGVLADGTAFERAQTVNVISTRSGGQGNGKGPNK